MNRKGNGDTVFKLMFGMIALVAIFYAVAMIWPIGSNVFNQISSSGQTVTNSLGNNGVLSTNDTRDLNQSIVNVNSGVQNSSWIPYTLFVGLIVCGGIFAYNSKAHPYLLPAWIAIIIFCTFFSIGLSQSYELNINNSIYAGQDPFTDLLARNMPIIIPVIGAVLGILMFVIIYKEPEYEVQTAG